MRQALLAGDGVETAWAKLMQPIAGANPDVCFLVLLQRVDVVVKISCAVFFSEDSAIGKSVQTTEGADPKFAATILQQRADVDVGKWSDVRPPLSVVKNPKSSR